MPYLGYTGNQFTGWLTQDYSNSGSDVIAQVGANGIATGTGFTLDAVNTFQGSSSIEGLWRTPVAGITAGVDSENWRYEMFIRFSGGNNNTTNFISFFNGGGSAYHFDLAWGNSALGSVLNGNYTTAIGTAGATLRSVASGMVRPNATDFYHFAFQYNAPLKYFHFYLAGVLIYGFGDGITAPFDGTNLNAIWSSTTCRNNHGGATIRRGFPNANLYPVVSLDAQAFTPPTTRLNVW